MGTPGAPEGAGLSSVMGDLDDALPPSLRTAKAIAKKLGPNLAGKAACMAIAAGERLTRTQKKALFRMGKAAGVDDSVMVSIVKQCDGVGVTPMELAALGQAAHQANVPKNMVGNIYTGVAVIAAAAAAAAAAVVLLLLSF
jgi:hypothetical protein